MVKNKKTPTFNKITFEENVYFLKSTENLHKCEMLQTFPSKSGQRHMLWYCIYCLKWTGIHN